MWGKQWSLLLPVEWGLPIHRIVSSLLDEMRINGLYINVGL